MPAKKKSKAKLLSYWKSKCWDTFSVYIRMRDADEYGVVKCYTCDKIKPWKELQAGHAIPGRNNAVLLDQEIVRPQCVKCNVFDRGMHHVFSTKLILENGLDWWLEKLANSKKIVKISRQEYETMTEELKDQISLLE